jgi:hypothetical protein
MFALRPRASPAARVSYSASGFAPKGVVRIAPIARRRATTTRAGWVLKNAGPKSTDHLGEACEIPKDLPLTKSRMVVGRTASDSVSLEIPVPTVSGAHAMIEVSDAKVMITDLSSTNGTFIEGDELQAGIEYELKEGGEVVFGDEFLALYILQKT